MIGPSHPNEIAEELILDSLLFLQVVPKDIESVVDIGSGAGLPGIPIKIVRPSIRMLLVESRQRRASFLSAVVRDLSLTETQVLSERVLTAPTELRSTFDCAVARCAGSPGSTMRLGAEFVRKGGIVVLAGSPNQDGPTEAAETSRRVIIRSGSGRSRSFLVKDM